MEEESVMPNKVTLDDLKVTVGNLDAILAKYPRFAERMREIEASKAEEIDLATGPVTAKVELEWSQQEIDDYIWRHSQ